MGMLEIFFGRKKPGTANKAKERLQILIAHERQGRGGPEYLPQLRHDIMNVIRKYVPVADDAVRVEFEKRDELDILELNITLPDENT